MTASASAATEESRIRVTRVVHTIHATADLAACRARYQDLMGGLVFAEGYFEGEDRDMALLYVTDTMIEPMAPRDPARLDKPFARYLQRYGEGFHSFELMVEDGPSASARLKEAGYKLASDYGIFFFVRQESGAGVLLEVCATPMPNDPHDRAGFRADWSGRHRSGVTGLDHIACVVPDVEAALALFTGQFDGELIADERIAAPQAARRVLVGLAGVRVAFIQPDDAKAGPLGGILAPPTSGVYALVWRVADAAAAESWFAAKGARATHEDCISQGFAIDPRDFMGARHEFVQQPQT
jgi:catechol 2,3-dioxygenase-like lactoylglutathione lyase family enzyme